MKDTVLLKAPVFSFILKHFDAPWHSLALFQGGATAFSPIYPFILSFYIVGL
jgi:hypothetical protein